MLNVNRLTVIRVLAVALVVALIVVLERSGVFEYFKEPAAIQAFLLRTGPWGYATFVGTYALLQPFGVPGTVFILAAPLVWPWPTAFLLSMVGTMAASVIGFSFARFVAREWFEQRVPQRFRKYEDLLERRAFAAVVLLRFLFWMPQALHAFFGVSRVSFWTHFNGSVVGYALPLLATSYFGEQVFHWLSAWL